MQTSEQIALEQAAAAENSSRLLAQELRDSRDAADALQQARHLAEVRLCAIRCGACAE